MESGPQSVVFLMVDGPLSKCLDANTRDDGGPTEWKEALGFLYPSRIYPPQSMIGEIESQN